MNHPLPELKKKVEENEEIEQTTYPELKWHLTCEKNQKEIIEELEMNTTDGMKPPPTSKEPVWILNENWLVDTKKFLTPKNLNNFSQPITCKSRKRETIRKQNLNNQRQRTKKIKIIYRKNLKDILLTQSDRPRKNLKLKSEHGEMKASHPKPEKKTWQIVDEKRQFEWMEPVNENPKLPKTVSPCPPQETKDKKRERRTPTYGEQNDTPWQTPMKKKIKTPFERSENHRTNENCPWTKEKKNLTCTNGQLTGQTRKNWKKEQRTCECEKHLKWKQK